MQDQGPGMTHDLVEVAHDVDRMTGIAQLLADFRAEASLDSQARRRLAPCAAEQPSRRCDRLLEWLPENGVARKDGSLRLGLTISTHRSENHDPSVIQFGKGGLNGVKRPLERLDAIVMVFVEREACSAILPGNAGAR